MCRRTEEGIGPTVGLPRHRHSVGFFNLPVLEKNMRNIFGHAIFAATVTGVYIARL